MKFLLDTDTISFALRGEGRVAERLASYRPSQVAASVVTEAELYFGAAKRNSKRLETLLDDFFSAIETLPLTSGVARRYGRLAADLRAAGEPIGQLDTMIAAHAIELGLTLASHNQAHFRRVPGLALVDWY